MSDTRKLPRISLRRALLIARRDFLGYVKTWGFWISFFLPVVFGLLGFMLSRADISLAPERYVTILNFTDVENHEARLDGLYEEIIDERRERILAAKSVFLTEKAQRDEFDRLLKDEGYAPALAYLEAKAPSMTQNIEDPDREFNLIAAPATTLEGLKPYLRGEVMAEHEGQSVPLSGVIVLRTGEADHRPVAEYWTTNFNPLQNACWNAICAV